MLNRTPGAAAPGPPLPATLTAGAVQEGVAQRGEDGDVVPGRASDPDPDQPHRPERPADRLPEAARWTSWHRWTVLAMLALAFLAVTAATERARAAPPAGLIPLTPNEIRRLFIGLLTRVCHAAIVSREFNIPCVIGTGSATHQLRSGDVVEVRADDGLVRLIRRAA